jgi:hypothetical protein
MIKNDITTLWDDFRVMGFSEKEIEEETKAYFKHELERYQNEDPSITHYEIKHERVEYSADDKDWFLLGPNRIFIEFK